jgi:hypothetical protein
VSAQTIGYAFWAISFAAEIGICVLLWRKQLRQRYPIFFAYCAYQVLSTVVLFAVERVSGQNGSQYFYAYWSVNAVSVGLGFGVIYELFRHALKPYHALRDLGTMLFTWITLMMLLVSVLLTVTGPASSEPARVVSGVLSLERDVRLMQSGMLLFFVLFGSKLGLTMRHRTYGIALGIGVYAATDLLFVSLRTKIGPEWALSYSLLHQFFWVAACATWVYYVVRPEPAPVMLPSMAAARPILQRWNEALAEASAGYGSAMARIDTPDPFTSTVEKTVERVLRRDISNR